ncbi:MAG: hypothetical protein C0515_07665 [Novosphingobium sp.]|nr:hypothetical protein [Novosphingobium sp.]
MLLALLVVHIAAGLIALLAALCAMAAPKRSGALHARAGTWFVGAMATMASCAALLTRFEPDRLSLGAALWTLHLIFTAQDAAANRDGRTGRRARWALLPGLAALALLLHGALAASQAADGRFQGSEAAGYLAFGGFCALSLLYDLSLFWRAPLAARARIARHLWRMCTATFLAVTSLFLGQQDDVFPFMAGSPLLLVPSLLTLGFMAFWILRVRLARNWLGVLPRRTSTATSLNPKDPL